MQENCKKIMNNHGKTITKLTGALTCLGIAYGCRGSVEYLASRIMHNDLYGYPLLDNLPLRDVFFLLPQASLALINALIGIYLIHSAIPTNWGKKIKKHIPVAAKAVGSLLCFTAAWLFSILIYDYLVIPHDKYSKYDDDWLQLKHTLFLMNGITLGTWLAQSAIKDLSELNQKKTAECYKQ